jgi:alpha-amylase/alpha-mannosidase (GH57 family)
MHQPYYKDPFTGIYRLPWVRLHGTKDYLDMVRILKDFPAIRQNFNLVPSLLEQLRDYIENNATDRFLELTLKKPSDLSESEKIFILENFFLANWDNMIKPFPRYYELLIKRGFRFTKKDIPRISRYFSDSDIRDLQVLFNLCWIDPIFREEDPQLKWISKKGRDFSEEDKEYVITKQFEILKQIIPEYKKFSDSGQIELSVTPFYHPILPLLWDTDSAKIAMPNAKLPKYHFSYPEDAIKQIRMALDYFEKTFGYRPQGMWPSEGSVSEDVVRAIVKEGIRWIATDEEILAKSLNKYFRSPEGFLINAKDLYKPYQFSNISILFRDHKLSDLIGFVYSGWNAERAVNDFIEKLKSIRNTLPNDRPYIVPIILDGENAWEYYKNDGHDFLKGLYNSLSSNEEFKTVTISEFLDTYGEGERLSRLHAGSWINANFSIWIGHEEDNLAWDYLSQTRKELEEFAKNNPDKDLSEAYKAIYAAEGSDWNWWYGDEHATETQEDFDELFRSYLMKVYKVIGKEIPSYLYVPILLEDRSVEPAMTIRGFIYPKIDGLITSYFEWYQSAYVDIKRSGGSMHKIESFVTRLYYGFNKDNLYIRVDPLVPFHEIKEPVILQINIAYPNQFKIVFNIHQMPPKALVYEKIEEQWNFVKETNSVAAKDIFEIEIPFSDIKVKENDEIHFSVTILRNGDEIERCPWRGHITVVAPTAYYEAMMWY